MRNHYLFRSAAALLALAAAGAPAACSDAGNGAGDDGGPVTVTGSDGVTLTVERTGDLAEGDVIQVDAAGLDPSSGYYLALCGVEAPAGQPFPDCAGDRSGDTQKWIRNPEGTEHMNDDGTMSTTLAITPTGESVDCRTTACAVKLFGDHREAFHDIAEVPVTLR